MFPINPNHVGLGLQVGQLVKLRLPIYISFI